jgi:hypothetical protein
VGGPSASKTNSNWHRLGMNAEETRIAMFPRSRGRAPSRANPPAELAPQHGADNLHG